MQSDEQLKHWAAIRESPEDDTPRLVYADWLEGHGEENRAQFIRVQCALEKLGPDRRKGRKERVLLEPREKYLLDKFGDHWLAPLRVVLAGSCPWDREDGWLNRLEFRRGFLRCDHFGLESTRRLAEAGNLVEPVNLIRFMECGAQYRHESVVEIARWEGAGCLVDMSVAWGTDRDIAAIVHSKYLRNLRHLGIWHGKVTDGGLAMLAAWPLAASLKSLDLQNNTITDDGAFSLADSPYINELRRLDLHGTQIGQAGQRRLLDRFGDAVQL
jgi:uncharacterized protein (TIGR02996 family)